MTFVRPEKFAACGPASSPAFASVARTVAVAVVMSSTTLLVAACGSDDDGADPAAAGSAGTSSGGSASNAGSAGDGNGGSNTGGANGGAGGTTVAGGGPCNVVTVASPPALAVHVTQCSDIEYSTNPPSGGEHYGAWANFQTYDFPLSAGYLVHDLEHGAVVFWYNCPEGCADEVADVQALIDALPVDPLCAGTGAERRAILVPYPALASRWGVSAWGHALTADCVDGEAFSGFYTEHYAQGPEQLCNPNQNFTADPCQ